MIIQYRKQYPKQPDEWQLWFAWRPVRINHNELLWLERCLRKAIPKTYADYDDWTRYYYKAIE